MPTLAEIQSIMQKNHNMKSYADRREIKELSDIMQEGETLENIVQGICNKKIGLLAVTDRRLIFIDKGLLWSAKTEIFPYEKITSIQYDTNMLGGTITIFSAGDTTELSAVNEEQGRIICTGVRSRIEKTAEALQPQAAKDDFISGLERLSVLYRQGLITEEEFSIAKKKLLGNDH